MYQKKSKQAKPLEKVMHLFFLKPKSNKPSCRSILLLGSQHIFSSGENVPACNMYITISVADGLLWVIIKSPREITDPIRSSCLVSPQFLGWSCRPSWAKRKFFHSKGIDGSIAGCITVWVLQNTAKLHHITSLPVIQIGPFTLLCYTSPTHRSF